MLAFKEGEGIAGLVSSKRGNRICIGEKFVEHRFARLSKFFFLETTNNGKPISWNIASSSFPALKTQRLAARARARNRISIQSTCALSFEGCIFMVFSTSCTWWDLLLYCEDLWQTTARVRLGYVLCKGFATRHKLRNSTYYPLTSMQLESQWNHTQNQWYYSKNKWNHTKKQWNVS